MCGRVQGAPVGAGALLAGARLVDDMCRVARATEGTDGTLGARAHLVRLKVRARARFRVVRLRVRANEGGGGGDGEGKVGTRAGARVSRGCGGGEAGRRFQTSLARTARTGPRRGIRRARWNPPPCTSRKGPSSPRLVRVRIRVELGLGLRLSWG